MRNELEIILSNLVPEYVREENPVVTEMFRIFLEYVGETSHDKVKNIANLVKEVQTKDAESKTHFTYKKENTKGQNIELKQAFVNIFVTNLNQFFDRVRNDKEINYKLEEYANLLGLTKETLYDIDNLQFNINEETISSSKPFSQTKGTKVPFDYLANLLEDKQVDPGLVPIDDIEVYDYIDPITGLPEPLKYNVESSMHQVVFNKAFRPMVHPVGFDVVYARLLKMLFEDHFTIRIEPYGYNIKLLHFNGDTKIWEDKLDQYGNVVEQVIDTFKSNVNLYGFEELDIRMNTKERLYQVGDGDVIYYDTSGIPHEYKKEFYKIEYSFRKRIIYITTDVHMMDETKTFVPEDYNKELDGQNLVDGGTADGHITRFDYLVDNSSLEDVKLYIEPDLFEDDKFVTEQFPDPDDATFGCEKEIWLNNSPLINPAIEPRSFNIGDGTKIQEDDDRFWHDTNYYLTYYTKILREQNEVLETAQREYDAYSTRAGRNFIGAWQGDSDWRTQEEAIDIPFLEGWQLRKQIRDLEAIISTANNVIPFLEIKIAEYTSGKDKLSWITELPEMIEEFVLEEDKTVEYDYEFSEQIDIDDDITHMEMIYDMSFGDGFTAGVNPTGLLPVGNEDSYDFGTETGFYTYNAVNPTVVGDLYFEAGYVIDTIDDNSGDDYVLGLNTVYDYNLVDFIFLDGDALTEDSVTITEYNDNINTLNDLIVQLELDILEVSGTWGFIERSQLRSERDEAIKNRDALQIELDEVLLKYA